MPIEHIRFTRSRLIAPLVRQIWVASDGSGRIIESNSNDGAVRYDDTYVAGELYYLDYTKYPIDVAALKEYLLKSEARGDKSVDSDAIFTGVGDLLRETATPPELRSATFKTLLETPGLVIKENDRDHKGRDAVSVSYASNKNRIEETLYFDSGTSSYLGELSIIVEKQKDGNDMKCTGWNVAKVATTVDSIGDIPS